MREEVASERDKNFVRVREAFDRHLGHEGHSIGAPLMFQRSHCEEPVSEKLLSFTLRGDYVMVDLSLQ